jgi:hypothetical protein
MKNTVSNREKNKTPRNKDPLPFAKWLFRNGQLVLGDHRIIFVATIKIQRNWQHMVHKRKKNKR